MFSEKENVLHAGPQMQPGRSVGLGKLAPKTPNNLALGMKTPFRAPLGGENGETLKKGLTVKKSIFQQDASKFATPIGPRRVPLGGKTTNAKALNSSGKGKVKLTLKETKVESPLAKIIGEGDEYPEPEYMPPKPIDLPDIPDDYIEPDYDLIKQNLFTGCYAAYMDEIDEEGKTKTERDLESRLRESDLEMIAEAEIYMNPTSAKQERKPGLRATKSKTFLTSKLSTNVASTKAPPKSATASRSSSRTEISSTTSRPTSRVGRQTSNPNTIITTRDAYKRPTTATSQRAKTPTTGAVATSKPAITHKRSLSSVPPPLSRSQTFSSTSSAPSTTSRPTTSGSTSGTASRVSRSQSRAVSSASNPSNHRNHSTTSRPATARSSTSTPTASNAEARHSARMANSLTSIGYTSGRNIGSGLLPNKPSSSSSSYTQQKSKKKTIDELEDEALEEMAMSSLSSLLVFKDEASGGEERGDREGQEGNDDDDDDSDENQNGFPSASDAMFLEDEDLEFRLVLD